MYRPNKKQIKEVIVLSIVLWIVCTFLPLVFSLAIQLVNHGLPLTTLCSKFFPSYLFLGAANRPYYFLLQVILAVIVLLWGAIKRKVFEGLAAYLIFCLMMWPVYIEAERFGLENFDYVSTRDSLPSKLDQLFCGNLTPYYTPPEDRCHYYVPPGTPVPHYVPPERSLTQKIQ